MICLYREHVNLSRWPLPPSPAVTRACWTCPTPWTVRTSAKSMVPATTDKFQTWADIPCLSVTSIKQIIGSETMQPDSFIPFLHVCIIYLLLILLILLLLLHLHRLVRLWCPPSLLFFGHCGIFPMVKESYSFFDIQMTMHRDIFL